MEVAEDADDEEDADDDDEEEVDDDDDDDVEDCDAPAADWPPAVLSFELEPLAAAAAAAAASLADDSRADDELPSALLWELDCVELAAFEVPVLAPMPCGWPPGLLL